MELSDKDSNRVTAPDERIAALEKSVRETEAELLTLYTNTAIHLAMIREDTAEHTRLCDLPELDAAWNVLTPDAQKRSTQASVDLYALVAAADPGYALLLAD